MYAIKSSRNCKPSEELIQLSQQVASAANKVHSVLGTELLEEIYRECLVAELKQMGLKIETDIPVPIDFGGKHFDCCCYLEILVEDKLIVEVKSDDKFLKLHEAQLRTHLKVSRRLLGLLINFGAPRSENRIKQVINDEYHDDVPGSQQ